MPYIARKRKNLYRRIELKIFRIIMDRIFKAVQGSAQFTEESKDS